MGREKGQKGEMAPRCQKGKEGGCVEEEKKERETDRNAKCSSKLYNKKVWNQM